MNVSPEELAAFARSQGMNVHLAMNGDRALLKRFLAAGYPVIVETWFITHDSGGMGHYRLLTGYDDTKGAFSALDSYMGPLTMPYARFDELWRSFGRTFLVVSPPNRPGRCGNCWASARTLRPRSRRRCGWPWPRPSGGRTRWAG